MWTVNGCTLTTFCWRCKIKMNKIDAATYFSVPVDEKLGLENIEVEIDILY